MENASKALIIAAAILISIMIISLGIWVFSMANKATSGVNLDEATVSQFNQQFAQYEGTRKSGSIVKTLLGTVRSNNTSHVDDASMRVAVTGAATMSSNKTTANDITTEYNTAIKAIENGSTYDVSFEYAESGLINKITITKRTK
jgi:hypothetical protein